MSYNAGEIAGFADSVAEAYVKTGIAEWHKPFDTGAAAQTAGEETIEEIEGTEPTESQAGSGNRPATEQASATEDAAQAQKPTSRRGR